METVKLKNGDNVYYQNNPAKFISYLSDSMAVVIVEAFPDFENTTTVGTCQGCCVGDNDNKLQCTCEDTEHILEMLEDNTNPTKLPLIVDVNMIFNKPMVVLKHEKELSRIKSLRDLMNSDVKILREDKSKLTKENSDLSLNISELKQAHENYKGVNIITIEEFIKRLSQSMANIMYSENDSRKVVGVSEEKVFKFNGFNYRITVEAFWEKSFWHSCKVVGIDSEYLFNDDYFD